MNSFKLELQLGDRIEAGNWVRSVGAEKSLEKSEGSDRYLSKPSGLVLSLMRITGTSAQVNTGYVESGDELRGKRRMEK